MENRKSIDACVVEELKYWSNDTDIQRNSISWIKESDLQDVLKADF